jgi:hypothetical protein
MKRTACITATVVLWVLGAGCQSRYQPAQARIQITVFEAPAPVIRQYTLGTKMHQVPDSSYLVTVISREALQNILTPHGGAARLLYEDSRVVRDWPRATDSWSYCHPFGGGPDGACSGGAAGFLGVRGGGNHLETRINYIVNHRGPNGRKAVESSLSFDSYFPLGRVLLFFAPSQLSSRFHAIAFQATPEAWTAPYDKAKYGLNWLDRPALNTDRRTIAGMMR